MSSLALLWALGCDSGDSGTDPEDSAAADTTFRVATANNYFFEGLLDAPSYPVRAEMDVEMDWSGLTHDIQCHDLDPVADIDSVQLIAFPRLNQLEVEEGLSRDSLQQADLGAYLTDAPGDETRSALSEVTFCGTDPQIEPLFTEGSGSWLVLLTAGDKVGVGARMLFFIEPLNEATSSRADVTGGCEVLDYTVDLDALAPASIPAGRVPMLDWSAVTATGQGLPMVPTNVSQLQVAWFADLTLPELEANFLDLDQLATQRWRMEHESGVTDDMSELVEVTDGSPFTGFTSEGVWLMGLFCDSCPNPAPLFLTRVVVE